ncbi:MAG: VOC family protein [Porticoccaceae bacterium]
MLNIQSLHHIRVGVTDLAGNERFARDFGLQEAARDGQTVYFRGHGADAYCYVAAPAARAGVRAVAFLAGSPDDLDEAVRRFGATAPRALRGPGGGTAVSLTDPDGITIDIVHGIAGREPDPLLPVPVINYPGRHQRFNASQHFRPPGPARPLRLGHLGLFVGDFRRTEAWYCEVLGMRASDRMYMGAPDQPVGGFYRLDRGAQWVDHHIIGFFGMGRPGLHHMSFEVQDIEQQMVAHRHLRKQGHQPVWGVGRHPLGSHVFDLWKDPNGLRFETYSDTDLCNDQRPTGDHDVAHSEMDLWSNEPAEPYFA